MQLVLDTTGLKLSKKNHSFLVESEKGARTVSPKKITSIAITATVLISSDAIVLAIKNQIPILFFDRIGKAQARLWSPYFESIATLRRQQIKFAESSQATSWMIDLFLLKTQGQINNLKYLQKRLPAQKTLLDAAITQIERQKQAWESLRKSLIENSRNQLMGIEGNIGRIYWQHLGQWLPLPGRFTKRSRQPAEDPFNAAINYLYGMLYSVVEGALFAAGLDPHLGILHTDEHNKPTLAYDLIEPFRPWLDRLLVQQCLGETMQDQFFARNQYGFSLNKSGKAFFIPLFNDFMRDTRRFNGIESNNRNHIYLLASKLALRMRTFDQNLTEPENDLIITEPETPE